MHPLEIEDLDHLGLVAGRIDELGLVELTNEEIEPHCLEQVSAGQVVKAMILRPKDCEVLGCHLRQPMTRLPEASS